MSLSMANGSLLYQYDLGSGVARLSPKAGKTFNDGEWHSVKFKRKEKSGILHVDGQLGNLRLLRLLFVRDGIHSVADYNSTLMGVFVVVVVVVVVVVRIFHDGITQERLELSS